MRALYRLGRLDMPGLCGTWGAPSFLEEPRERFSLGSLTVRLGSWARWVELEDECEEEFFV